MTPTQSGSSMGVEEGTRKGQGAGGVGLIGLARVGLGKHKEIYHETATAVK
ncbi:MAG TPA: hypothetical protein VN982_07325 [Candidatus Dormibacteraeota bacterium]|nr:hypothetical protein [Candidatus Dormibacteraeota bacterium]